MFSRHLCCSEKKAGEIKMFCVFRRRSDIREWFKTNKSNFKCLHSSRLSSIESNNILGYSHPNGWHLYEINDDKAGAVAIRKQAEAGVDCETRDCRRCLSVHPGRQADLSKSLISLSIWRRTRSGWKPPGFFTAPPRTWDFSNEFSLLSCDFPGIKLYFLVTLHWT